MPKNTMPAAVWPSFWTHSERLASFTRKPKSKFAWPHSQEYSVTPDSLAHAGFYSRNSASSPDSVVCFACPTSLSGWCEGDDALDEHIQHASKFGSEKGYQFCWYAEIMLVERQREAALQSDPPAYSFTRNPKSEQMQICRLLSFGENAARWIHEDKRGWVPKAAKLSEAGFYYNGVNDSPDSVMCAYCGYEVEGWEKEDDPLTIHMKKYPSCPFFTYNHSKLEEPAIPERTSSENTKSKSKTTTQTKKTQQGPKKSKAARIDSDRDVSEARLSVVDEDAEDEEQVQEILGVHANPRKTRSKRSALSKSTNSTASMKRSAPSRTLSNLSLASSAPSAANSSTRASSKSTRSTSKNNLNATIISTAPSTSSVPPSPPASVTTETSRRLPSPTPTENSTTAPGQKKRGRPKGVKVQPKSKTVLGVNDPNRSQVTEDEEILSISQLSLNPIPPPKTPLLAEEPPSPSPRSKDKLAASSPAKITTSYPSGSPTPKPSKKTFHSSNNTHAQVVVHPSPLGRPGSSKSAASASSSTSSSQRKLSTDSISMTNGRRTSKDAIQLETQEIHITTTLDSVAPPLPEKDAYLLNDSKKKNNSLFEFRLPARPQSNSVLFDGMFKGMEISEEDGKMSLIGWIERMKAQKMDEARQICQRDLEEFDVRTAETRDWIQKVSQQSWST